jgi:hypothetical protein
MKIYKLLNNYTKINGITADSQELKYNTFDNVVSKLIKWQIYILLFKESLNSQFMLAGKFFMANTANIKIAEPIGGSHFDINVLDWDLAYITNSTSWFWRYYKLVAFYTLLFSYWWAAANQAILKIAVFATATCSLISTFAAPTITTNSQQYSIFTTIVFFIFELKTNRILNENALRSMNKKLFFRLNISLTLNGIGRTLEANKGSSYCCLNFHFLATIRTLTSPLNP